MLNSSALGFAGMCGFQTKAEALQYAINFTATITDNGTKANYEAAQELFDFICNNVKLPDIKGESLDGFMDKSSALLDSLYSKIGSIQENEYPATPEECKDNPEDNPEDNEEESEMIKEWFGEICDGAAEFAKKDWENMTPENKKVLNELFNEVAEEKYMDVQGYIERLRNLKRHLAKHCKTAQHYDVTLNFGGLTKIEGWGETNGATFDGPHILPALHAFINTLIKYNKEEQERMAKKA